MDYVNILCRCCGILATVSAWYRAKLFSITGRFFEVTAILRSIADLHRQTDEKDRGNDTDCHSHGDQEMGGEQAAGDVIRS
jgi:hypothetical protein